MEEKLQKISNSALKFLIPQETQEVYSLIVKEAADIIGGDFGSVILSNGKSMLRVYASNHEHFTSRVRKRANTYQAYSQQKILVVPIEKLAGAHPELVQEKVKSSVFIPLTYESKSIGVLIINSKKEISLSQSDMHILSLFGAMASLAIRKTQLYTETKIALETRDHFISLASHELRTPLTSINGYIQLLHSKMKGKDTSESKWVEELYTESKRLTELIMELMEINRIKQGTLQFDLVENNIGEFFEDMMNAIMTHTEREIIFKSDIKKANQTFIADPEKLINVFVGLVNNAEKFSPKNSPITVKFSSNSSKLTISVIDIGSGMSRDDLSRVFEGFSRPDNQEGQGFGVGLLLAKHIIKFHHGSIEIHSKPKKGTRVEVKLPLLDK